MTARVTRRLLLGAAAVGTAGAPVLARPVHADAELLAACRAFHEEEARQRARDRIGGVSDAESDAMHARWRSALAPIEAMAPQTEAGIRAKAGVAYAVLMSHVHVEKRLDWRAQADTAERLAIDTLAAVAGLG